MQQRRLGRGLESLLENSGQTGSAGADSIVELPLDSIFPNPDQPRKDFEDEALAELSRSIAEKGVIQPILVVAREDSRYMIVAGERRYRASLLAGKTSIPALVRDYGEQETMEIALIENLQREDLNPLEEAQAFKNLIDKIGLSQDEIAKRIGKNRSTIANSLRLLKLPEAIQAAISNDAISAGHARAILTVSIGPEAQTRLFEAIVQKGLSVRDAEAMGREINQGAVRVSGTAREKSGSGADGGSGESVRRDPQLWDLEEKLIIALGTKVRIKGDSEKGRVEIDYYSLEDLERIYEIMSNK